jgi:hypothetical protein
MCRAGRWCDTEMGTFCVSKTLSCVFCRTISSSHLASPRVYITKPAHHPGREKHSCRWEREPRKKTHTERWKFVTKSPCTREMNVERERKSNVCLLPIMCTAQRTAMPQNGNLRYGIPWILEGYKNVFRHIIMKVLRLSREAYVFALPPSAVCTCAGGW